MITHAEWNAHIDYIKSLQDLPKEKLISEVLRLQDELQEAVKGYDRRIMLLERKMEVAKDAAGVLAQGVHSDHKSFAITYEEYPYSDTYDPDNDDFGENENVSTLIAFLNIFGGAEGKTISHYAKDPEEQDTLARQSATWVGEP